MKNLILKSLKHDPKERPKASELFSRLESLRVGDKTPSKATRIVSRWDYLLNYQPKIPWHFAQVWQVDSSVAAVVKKYSIRRRRFVINLISKIISHY